MLPRLGRSEYRRAFRIAAGDELLTTLAEPPFGVDASRRWPEVAVMRRETNADDLSSPSAFTLRDWCSECVRGRLPLPEALRDELSPLLLASAVQHLEV